MKITFVLKGSLYSCELQIADSCGIHYYSIPSVTGDDQTESSVTVDIFGSEFDLTLTPAAADIDSILNTLDESRFMARFAKKATKFLFSSIEQTTLLVGCTYHIDNMQDGDRAEINLHHYIFGSSFTIDILELMPMMYAFFEVSCFGERYPLTNAFGINRRQVISLARKLTLLEMDILIILYPIQVGRIKRLSKNKKVFKTLLEFNRMTQEERQRFAEKQEKIL